MALSLLLKFNIFMENREKDMKERKLSDRKNTFFEDSNAIEYED